MIQYFESTLSGYIGVAIMVLGLLTSIAPQIINFIPAQYQPTVSSIIVLLGGVKSWLALNPFSQIVASPALVSGNMQNVSVVPMNTHHGVNTHTANPIMTTPTPPQAPSLPLTAIINSPDLPKAPS